MLIEDSIDFIIDKFYEKQTENDQVLDEIRNKAKSELQLVNEAIRKLANDQYGDVAIVLMEFTMNFKSLK
ncbi:hypothetical protein [Pseudoalteromonas sp. '520P1 No. 412']|uniref:hypothetical protein n=1 Tax=Pseudoalteromonas sp. '520P1 No. 412' TaxID=304208 RepID=UPI0005A915F0|nr:hypothetical protein [Pseudoalteromonas sp. '520P1 No. 412']